MAIQDGDVLETSVAQLQRCAQAEHAGSHDDNLALFIHPQVWRGMGLLREVVLIDTDSQGSE